MRDGESAEQDASARHLFVPAALSRRSARPKPAPQAQAPCRARLCRRPLRARDVCARFFLVIPYTKEQAASFRAALQENRFYENRDAHKNEVLNDESVQKKTGRFETA
jgi:hypothetical protein